jgi:hypothetical protein
MRGICPQRRASTGTSRLSFEGEMKMRTSPTARALEQAALYRTAQRSDDLDPPELANLQAEIAAAFNGFAAMFEDTSSAPDIEPMQWLFVYAFHRRLQRLEIDLDDNAARQRRSQAEQDGSEIKSGELETLVAKGKALSRRRDTLEQAREYAAHLFLIASGRPWQPTAGSKIAKGKPLTAAMLDSRDYLAARDKAAVAMPGGTRIAFAGPIDATDHGLIWAALDRARAEHPDMVLMHGGAEKGAELIAAKWAAARKVATIVFRPDWKRHHKSAPFRRNETLIEEGQPATVIICPGTPAVDHLGQTARRNGIPVTTATSV